MKIELFELIKEKIRTRKKAIEGEETIQTQDQDPEAMIKEKVKEIKMKRKIRY